MMAYSKIKWCLIIGDASITFQSTVKTHQEYFLEHGMIERSALLKMKVKCYYDNNC